MAEQQDTRGVSDPTPDRLIPAPELPYLPGNPKTYHPGIGLIACGDITSLHLKAYKAAGYNVVALCDPVSERCQHRQQEFYPEAAVYSDHHELLKREDIQVVDIAAHPAPRVQLIRDALEAGKHVLSQKPFVLDLNVGKKLVDLARKRNLKLAVNQNARWAPHISYIRHAVEAGVIGQVFAAHISVGWDHNWIVGREFEKIRHVILYDFAIHWFDMLTLYMGGREAKRVYASFVPSPSQQPKPALLGQALMEYEQAQATLTFDGDVKFGKQDRTYVAGTKGTLVSIGPNILEQQVTLYTSEGYATPSLQGNWFTNGFHGTMAELLCAIEENRQPRNSAETNLKSLALCFAAIASAEDHKPKVPGKVLRIPAAALE